MPHPIQRIFNPLYHMAHYPEVNRYQTVYRRWVLDRMLSHIDPAPVKTVVEMGCGSGAITGVLAQQFERVIGFDINPHRIDADVPDNAIILAADAEAMPIADQSVDLLLSLDVLEHVRDRVAVLKALQRVVKPGGVMVHVMPCANWKVLQYLGFIPDELRKHARGITRFLSGHRKQRGEKFRPGTETNNPYRTTRRRWYHKLVPRVHGEYHSNWHEFRQWTDKAWRRQFEEAGLEVVAAVNLGMHSPYSFGLPWLARNRMWGPIASERGYILKTRD